MSTPDTPPREDGRTRRVRRLVDELAEARELHALTADPHLTAVRAERFRLSITRGLWFFLACGLGFTTTGVHAFLAGDREPDDPLWWGAWLVEPALAGILITVLRWEAEVLARGLEITARSVGALKWVLLGATLFMNVYPTLAPPPGGSVSVGSVFVHLVIPVIVFLIAQVVPVVQQTCARLRDTPPPAPTPAVTEPAAQAHDTAPPATTAPTEPPTPAAPTPPPVLAPAPAPGRVRLPDDLAAKVAASITYARAQGRTPSVADVQSVVRLSDALAARVLADHITNGHPVA
ncbi:hypothetical protein [Actinokineospora sp. NPDC004072]